VTGEGNGGRDMAKKGKEKQGRGRRKKDWG